MSKERGKMTPVAEEAYSLRDIISKVTGMGYGIREALPDFPPPADHATWYLLGREFRLPNGAPYANVIWEDVAGNIFIQSIEIGESADWIGPIYGEDGIIAAMRMDYSTPDRGRKAFAKKFPAVEKRISGYEDVISRISLKHRASLSLRWDGEIGSGTFRIEAKISESGRTEKEEVIRRNFEALKSAWTEITQYNQNEVNRR
jgi:hypothetical protein